MTEALSWGMFGIWRGLAPHRGASRVGFQYFKCPPALRPDVRHRGASAGRRTLTFLLDVDVLVALAWPNHLHRETAHRWCSAHQRSRQTPASFQRLALHSRRSSFSSGWSRFLASVLD